MTLKASADVVLNKVGLQLSADVVKVHRFIETWLFALLGISGDLYNELISGGYLNELAVPKQFVSGLHLLSLAAIVIKFVKRNVATAEADVAKELTPPPAQ